MKRLRIGMGDEGCRDGRGHVCVCVCVCSGCCFCAYTLVPWSESSGHLSTTSPLISLLHVTAKPRANLTGHPVRSQHLNEATADAAAILRSCSCCPENHVRGGLTVFDDATWSGGRGCQGGFGGVGVGGGVGEGEKTLGARC